MNLLCYVYRGGDEDGRNQTHFADLGELEHSITFHHQEDAADLSRSKLIYSTAFLSFFNHLLT